MSLNGILANGLSAVLTNSAALRVTSNNIANINTPGYHRREVQYQALAPGGQLAGVGIADIRRIADAFLGNETLSATSANARYDAQNNLFDQLNASLGQPGDGSSILSQLDSLYASLGTVSVDPTSYARRQATLLQFQGVAKSISDLSGAVSDLRSSADTEIASTVNDVNNLLQRLYELNPQIQAAQLAGDTATPLADQRDQMMTQLSELIGVKTSVQSDGRAMVTTEDGTQLIGDSLKQLSYSVSNSGAYGPVMYQSLDPVSGQPIGTASPLDQHIGSGKIRGLLDMRDGTLLDLGKELGSLGQSLALAFNAQHNANATSPPATSFTGRDTGLIAGDGLRFTGATTIGVADAGGNLAHRIAVNFSAGTLSVDGGPTASLGTTIGSFATALNTALGSNGSASFTNGKLSIAASGGNGLVIADDASTPASRGGLGFSHFFGLNDVFEADGASVTTTGLAAADAHGLAPGGQMTLYLQGPTGARVNTVTLGVTGTTIGDMVSALNTAFSGKASFALDANGQLSETPAAGYSNYALTVANDSTARGTTGLSFSQLFGLGSAQDVARASGFKVRDALAQSPQGLALAQTSLTSTTTLGTQIVTPGDNRGALALQTVSDKPLSFSTVGGLQARTATLSDYTATLYQDIASRASTADARNSAEQARLQQAQSRQGQVEGVNLDEELSTMMTLQQAYNAGARIMKVAQDLYDTLLNAV